MTDIKSTVRHYDINILYAEDEPDTREEVAEYLRKRVRGITLASNGQEAVELFHKQKPDLVISDIRMPLMNGIDLVRAIRAENSSIPIILITAYNEPDYLIASIEMGVNNFVVKPVIFGKLLDAIEKCFS